MADFQRSAKTRVEYISSVVQPLVNNIVYVLLTERPQNPERFLLGWLHERLGETAEDIAHRLLGASDPRDAVLRLQHTYETGGAGLALGRPSSNSASWQDACQVVKDDCTVGQAVVSATVSKEESELLGISVAFLEQQFLQEIKAAFGPSADPNYYDVNSKMLFGPSGKGWGKMCPRDGQLHCSYVDALDGRYTGHATVMLSWSWLYTARRVVSSVSRWCRQKGMDLTKAFVWQCALCCNQYRVEARKAQNEWEPFETFRELFERRVRAIGCVLAILSPWNDPIYIQRMWCVFEFHSAINTDGCCLEIALPEDDELCFQAKLEAGSVPEVWKVFGKVKLQHASTTSPIDRANILALVDPVSQDYEKSESCAALNAAVIKRMQDWLLGIEVKRAESKLVSGEALCSLAPFASAARLLMEVASWHQAQVLIERTLQSQWADGISGTVDHAMLLQLLGSCCAKQKRAESLESFLQSKSIFETAGAIHTLEYAWLLKQMAMFQHTNDDSMKLFLEAQSVFQSIGATADPRYASLLNDMALCHKKLGDSSKEMLCYVEAKAVYENSTNGAETPGYAYLLSDMGSWHFTRGHYTDALELLTQAQIAFGDVGSTSRPEYEELVSIMQSCRIRLESASNEQKP